MRELENEVERAMALAYTDIVTTTDLSEAVQRYQGSKQAGESSLKSAEKGLIERTLLESGGNKTQAAERLGMSREGLRKKLKRLGIN